MGHKIEKLITIYVKSLISYLIESFSYRKAHPREDSLDRLMFLWHFICVFQLSNFHPLLFHS